MRGRSCSKQGGFSAGREIEKIDKLKEEPHLSGAYIRSLVKQLTSSRTNPKDHDGLQGDIGGVSTTLHHHETELAQPPPPQIKKKQVRRRLHTSRPYQERLLNMAEARREIVTALKFHRATMKQQQQQQQQQQSETLPQPEQEVKPKSRRNPRIYASNNTMNNSNLPIYTDSFTNSTFPCFPQYPYCSPVSSQPSQDNFNFPLPNQTLGLNLNFHDFNNLDANTSIYSFPSSNEFHYQEGPPMVAANSENCSLHQSMDDKEMAEIRSIGEQHQIEWNDTLNLATSAWWFKFLKATEIGHDEKIGEDYGCYPFDEVMEFPAWLNPNESCLQQHIDETFSEYFLQDPALPCMDIEEIEGMDAEWLA